MQITNIFPTPIGTDYYPHIRSLGDEWKLFLEEIASEENKDKLKFNVFERSGPTVKKFYDFMKSSVNEYAKLIGANAEFDVDHSWFFVDEDLSPHHHAHVPIVSAFYIQAENDQSTKRKFSSPIGDLVMLDPRGGVNLYCRPPANQAPGETRTGRNSTFNGSGCYNVTPGTGTILHFPGYLIHYVCQNITKNPRIVIGVNWERVIDLSKLDKSIPHTPRAIPLSHTQTNTSNHFKDYLSNKNIKV